MSADSPTSTAKIVRVFVFPLDDMVFFPRTAVPLNIFEPRYVKMLNDAFTSGTLLALAGEDPTSAKTPIVAGIGEARLLHRRPDGTMIVVVEGRSRVRIGKVLEQKPYIVCEAEVLGEESALDLSARAAVRRTRKLFGRWIAGHVKGEDEQAFLWKRARGPAELLDHVSMLMLEDATLKQALLECDALSERALLLSAALTPEGKPLQSENASNN